MGATGFEIAGGVGSSPPWYKVWVPKGLVQEGLKHSFSSDVVPIFYCRALFASKSFNGKLEEGITSKILLCILLVDAFQFFSSVFSL